MMRLYTDRLIERQELETFGYYPPPDALVLISR